MAIPGYLTIRGDGHVSIMAAGLTTTTMAGYGYPALIGGRHGYAGVMEKAFMAGRH